MMQTDVKAKSLTASGTVFGGPSRVKGVVVTCAATASSVAIKDGGSGGTTIMTINTLAGGETFNVLIPAEGVLFATSMYATLTNAKVTVFYA